MEKCSYFIQDRALFGSYPSQATVDLLEEQGVRYFIDLTEENETKIIPYNTKHNHIKYPIRDRFYPTNWRSFAQVVIKICKILTLSSDKIYVHCKGGHGRSGILVACVLCHYYKIPPVDALRKTSFFHSIRPVMREKWRKIGSPQSLKQKDFVFKFFRPLFFHKPTNSFSLGLHNQSPHPVKIQNHTFCNAYLAFQYFRDPENIEYVEELLKGNFKPELLNYEKKVLESRETWNKNKVDYMFYVIESKYLQNENIRRNFINTGLRPFVKVSLDYFWGSGENGQGKNIQGKLLDTIRIKLLENEENYLLPQQL